MDNLCAPCLLAPNQLWFPSLVAIQNILGSLPAPNPWKIWFAILRQSPKYLASVLHDSDGCKHFLGRHQEPPKYILILLLCLLFVGNLSPAWSRYALQYISVWISFNWFYLALGDIFWPQPWCLCSAQGKCFISSQLIQSKYPEGTQWDSTLSLYLHHQLPLL